MSKNILNITLVIFISLIATNSKTCENLSSFNTSHSKQLNQKSLNALFSSSRDEKGEGSFGVVKTITFDGKTIAAKRVKINKDHDLNYLQREIDFMDYFKQESDFPTFIDCAKENNNFPYNFYILQEALFKDFSKNETKIYFTETYSLYERIQRYKEIAQGLKKLHDNNIVHEDLKPENIMASDERFSHLKIIDLGMAGRTTEYFIGGSPLYNSPEKVNCYDDCENDPKHDMWAFALTVATIEAKSRYIFKNVPAISCFKMNFTSDCQEILMTNVGAVMNEVFGNNSPFTKAIKNCLVYNPSKRWSAEQVIKEIEKIEPPNSETDLLSSKGSKRANFGQDLEKREELNGLKKSQRRKKYFGLDHLYEDQDNKKENYELQLGRVQKGWEHEVPQPDNQLNLGAKPQNIKQNYIGWEHEVPQPDNQLNLGAKPQNIKQNYIGTDQEVPKLNEQKLNQFQIGLNQEPQPKNHQYLKNQYEQYFENQVKNYRAQQEAPQIKKNDELPLMNAYLNKKNNLLERITPILENNKINKPMKKQKPETPLLDEFIRNQNIPLRHKRII